MRFLTMFDLTYRERLLAFFLIIIYVVGIVGIAIPLHNDFVRLTPLNLVISAAVVWSNEIVSRRTILLYLFIFLFGFLAEAYGTNYGILFGNYQYGTTMGWSIWNTPLTAGILWVIVVSGAGSLMNICFPKWHIISKAIIGACLLVGLDIFIEPIAMRLHFWDWASNQVPLQNYIGWYIVSFLQLLVFHYFMPYGKNKIAIVLFLLQWLFFISLNLI